MLRSVLLKDIFGLKLYGGFLRGLHDERMQNVEMAFHGEGSEGPDAIITTPWLVEGI